jgi:hypothetical protein
MIAELALIAAFAVAGQDLIQADISGSRRWRVAAEGPGGIVAFIPIAGDGDTREVVLITTAKVAATPGEPAVPIQGFFVHTIDCKAWTQMQTGFGLTDPPPRRWTPMDGPPPSRPMTAPQSIQRDTAIANIAAAVCRDADLNLRQVEGDWSFVSRALRQEFDALSTPFAASDQ